ncbi:hypothetical protein [Algoriphagus pacificus]|uniref:Uncharacterized protein n=1 Tax=Algoriphagus pacificus TaxID=2811234 RepID=A0ABS3CL06_9BACT|nr:hypothetical protein [Algoriphagus pacificus]MBN7816910.1 hypothetical protein [Algoriphagus pacificus]
MIQKQDLLQANFKTEQVQQRYFLEKNSSRQNKTASIFRECHTTITTG